VEAHAPSVVGREYAVHHDGVEMKIEVQGAAKGPNRLRRRALPDGRR
jgi:hypothetical protein